MVDFRDQEVSPLNSAVTPKNVKMADPTIGLRGIAKGIDRTFSFVGDVLESQKNDAASKVLTDFANKQLSIIDGIDQGSLKSSQGRTLLRKNLSEYQTNNPALSKDLQTTMGRLLSGTGSGAIVQEGNLEEQAINNLQKEMVDNGWLSPGVEMTDKVVDEFRQWKRVNLELEQQNKDVANKRAELGLKKDRNELKQSDLKLLELNAQNKAKTALTTMSDLWFKNMNRTLTAFKTKVDAGELSAQDAITLARQRKIEIEQMRGKLGADAGGDFAKALVAPFDSMFQNFEEVVSGKISKDVFEQRNSGLLARQLNEAYTKDPRLARIASSMELLRNVHPDLQSIIVGDVIRFIEGNAQLEEGKKPQDIFPNTPQENKDVGSYLDVIKDGIKQTEDKTGLVNDPAKVSNDVNTQIDSMLKGVDVYKDSVNSPKEYNKVVDFLASPEFGRLVTKNGGVPSGSADTARNILKERYSDEVIPLISKRIDNAEIPVGDFTVASGVNPGNRPDIKSGRDLFEPSFDGGGVVFRMKEGVKSNRQTEIELRSVNADVSKILNRVIRLDAHLSGHTDYRSTWENNYAPMFGVGQPEKEKPSEVEVPRPQSKNEDGETVLGDFELDGQGMVVGANTPQVQEQLAEQEKADEEKSPVNNASVATSNSQLMSIVQHEVDAAPTKQLKEAARSLPVVAEVLDEIGAVESGRGSYNRIYSGGQGKVLAPLTTMTIKEVVALQDKMKVHQRNKGSQKVSTALGKYQFIQGTLKGLVKKAGLSGDEIFTPQLQDQLGIMLMKDRGLDKYLANKIDDNTFAENLAKEWAALPVLTDTKRGSKVIKAGQSFYSGDGLNVVGMSIGRMKSILRTLRAKAQEFAS